jgi:hypothetical protein
MTSKTSDTQLLQFFIITPLLTSGVSESIQASCSVMFTGADYGALCGIWANSKSFLLAPGSRADRVGQQATQRTVSTGMSGRIPISSEELL